MKRNVAILVALLVIVGGLVSRGRAQSVGIAPGDVRAEFKPGTPFEFAIAVQNYGATPVQLHVQITDFWYSDKAEVDAHGLLTHAKVFPTPGTAPRSAANWIQFVPEQFVLAPNAVQKMKAVVTPPANANDGGYYATLFIVSQPVLTNKVTKEGGAVYTNMRIGCLVLLSAKGTQKYNVTVNDVEVTPPTASADMKVRFTVDNESNTHIFSRARVVILDPQHKIVGKTQGDEKRLLPGQKERMEVSYAGKLDPGHYTAVLTLQYADTHVETRSVPFEVAP